LDDLATLITKIDDVQLVGNDIAIHLIEIAFCDGRCADAVAFASALRKRLRHYADDPHAAQNTRGVFRERVAWWQMAVSRAAELSRWPAVVLMETCSSG
jgi:hypothetical protein